MQWMVRERMGYRQMWATERDIDMSTPPRIVLVHGAWADDSSWDRVIERLQAARHTTRAVQVALDSLDDDVARTRAVLAAQSGTTLLVAHSDGGAIITRSGAGAPNAIGLVFESAFAPDRGVVIVGK
jgi:pimeloyl-ACP methyl ester carboxylesterase